MPSIQPHIIVPTLIEQPTWGGDYIATLKGIDSNILDNKKIGQSYELFRDSHLSLKKSTKDSPSLDLAQPDDPSNPKHLYTDDTPFSISQLIIQDPVQTLGTKAISNHGGSIEVLIKLNQAKGNSYQVHTREETDTWLPKPESWYFLEPGLVTLGLNPETQWQEYQECCELIEKEATLISKAILQEITSLEEGRKRLTDFITHHNPQKYVNLIQVGKNTAIDLSACGIHHSWEENAKISPQGNIVYEVQKNVYDPDCTIRSFDKGKIKEDGSLRDIHVTDYFEALVKNTESNNPEQYYTKGEVLKKTSTYTVKSIFHTQNYNLEQLTFTQKISNKWTHTNDSYHHLFVREGTVQLFYNQKVWTITQGFSIFIPAIVGQYQLKPYKSTHAQVLKTYV